jgi:hypothetical protein
VTAPPPPVGVTDRGIEDARLGLRANLGQFALLVAVSALVPRSGSSLPLPSRPDASSSSGWPRRTGPRLAPAGRPVRLAIGQPEQRG